MWRRAWVCSQRQPPPYSIWRLCYGATSGATQNHSFTTATGLGGEARNPTAAFSGVGLIPDPAQGGRIFQIHSGGQMESFLRPVSVQSSVSY